MQISLIQIKLFKKIMSHERSAGKVNFQKDLNCKRCPASRLTINSHDFKKKASDTVIIHSSRDSESTTKVFCMRGWPFF